MLSTNSPRSCFFGSLAAKCSDIFTRTTLATDQFLQHLNSAKTWLQYIQQLKEKQKQKQQRSRQTRCRTGRKSRITTDVLEPSLQATTVALIARDKQRLRLNSVVEARGRTNYVLCLFFVNVLPAAEINIRYFLNVLHNGSDLSESGCNELQLSRSKDLLNHQPDYAVSLPLPVRSRYIICGCLRLMMLCLGRFGSGSN